jgi:hypothetical protein
MEEPLRGDNTPSSKKCVLPLLPSTRSGRTRPGLLLYQQKIRLQDYKKWQFKEHSRDVCSLTIEFGDDQ